MSLLKMIDRRIIITLAIVIAVLIPLFWQGRASAVSLETLCSPSTVTQGNQLVCTLELTIRNTERIPLQGLSFESDGPTPVIATFDVGGNLIVSSPQLVSVSRTSANNVDFGYGYRFGFDELRGGGYDFGYGYGYGSYSYGYGSAFLQYQLVIDTSTMGEGSYVGRFMANTGDSTKPDFRSSDSTFTVTAAEPTTTPPTNTPVPPTDTPVPPTNTPIPPTPTDEPDGEDETPTPVPPTATPSGGGGGGTPEPTDEPEDGTPEPEEATPTPAPTQVSTVVPTATPTPSPTPVEEEPTEEPEPTEAEPTATTAPTQEPTPAVTVPGEDTAAGGGGTGSLILWIILGILGGLSILGGAGYLIYRAMRPGV